MKKLIFAAAAACLIATPAMATDWREIATSDTGDKFYLDFEGGWQPMAGGIRRIWSRADYTRPLGQSGAWRTLALDEYDCAQGRTRTIQSTGYDRAGNVVGSGGSGVWSYTAPGTVADGLLRSVCGRN